jgi:uncharacterized protein YjiS (DUF1127 family)
MLYASSPAAAGQLAPSRAARPAAPLAALWRAPSTLVGWFIQRRRIARAIATLGSLSDHTLKDIGIERSQIPRVARQGRG